MPTVTLSANEAWRARAGLLPDSVDPDRDTLRREAIEEGAVVVYSDTARMSRAASQLSSAFPGVNCQVWVANSEDLALRLVDEQAALADATGESPTLERRADVYLAGDPLRTGELIEKGLLWAYGGPDSASSSAGAPGLAVHHWSALLLAGNEIAVVTDTIDSLWDLTRPEWRGRVALPDPLIDQRTLCLLVAATKHADQLAASYRDEYGREIALDADCADAADQWIKALFANDPRLYVGDAEVAEYIGVPDAVEARIGLVGYEQYAKVAWGELAFEPLPEVEPVRGLYWATYLAIVNRCEHPSAARLAIRWLLGEGRETMEDSPWFQSGFYLVEEGAPDPPDVVPREVMRQGLWALDPEGADEVAHDMTITVARYLGRVMGGR